MSVKWELWDSADGTFLQGYLDVSYQKLVDTFGPPNQEGDGYKVDAEWCLKFGDEVATIYNYKDGRNYNGSSGMHTQDITDWHIGGYTKKVVDLVHNALGM